MEKDLATHLNAAVFGPAELTTDALNALEEAELVRTTEGALYRAFVDFKRIDARIAELQKKRFDDQEFPLRRLLAKVLRFSSDESSAGATETEIEELQRELGRLPVTAMQAHREELSRYAHVPAADMYVRLTEKGKDSLWRFLCSADAVDEDRAAREIDENVQCFHRQCQASDARRDVRWQMALASLASDAGSFERFSAFDPKVQSEWDHPDRHPFVAELAHAVCELRDLKSATSLLSKRLSKHCPSTPERLFAVVRLAEGVKGLGQDVESGERSSPRAALFERAERLLKILARMVESNFSVIGADAPMGARLARLRDDPHKVFNRVVECGKYVNAEPYQRRVACTILAHSDVYLNEKTDTAFGAAVPSVIARAREFASVLTPAAEGGGEPSSLSRFVNPGDICVLSAAMAQMPGSIAQIVELYGRALALLLQCGYTTAIDKLALLLMDGYSEYGGRNRDFLFELTTLCDGLDAHSIYFRKSESPLGASGFTSGRPVMGVSSPPTVEW